MNANYRLVGSLDSAKTAHYSSKAIERDNWWVPDDNKTWLLHTTSAAAMAIKQVLWGEIICVPRNQYLDSPGWLNIADFFIKSKLSLFSICIHDPGIDLTPAGFLIDCANQFKNVSGSSMFAMSGWPGLSPEERIKVYENLVSRRNFKDMLDGIKVDSSKREDFEYQRDTLQHVLEYLDGKDLIKRTRSPKSSTWDKVEEKIKNVELINNLKEIHGKEFAKDYVNAFREMKKVAKDKHKYYPKEQLKWLNQRSNLYQHIYDYDPKLRELLHTDIDLFYNQTICESSANNRLAFSDRADSLLPFDIRDKHMNLLDSASSESGISERSVLLPEEIEAQSHMVEDIVYALNNEDVTRQIERIRLIRISKRHTQHEIEEEELRHLDFLSQYFSNVIVKQSGKNKIVEYSYRGMSLGIKIIALHELGEYLGDFPVNPWVVTAAGELAGNLLEKAGVKISPIKEKVGDFFVQKDKELMIGRIRDWLDNPPPQN